MSLAAYLATLPSRCPRGFDYERQHPQLCTCQSSPEKRKAQGQARANAAASGQNKDQIDAAIRRAAASGREFSVNDIRGDFPDVTGAVVGGRFTVAANAGLIRDTGKRVPSTLPSTHGHEVRVWVGVT